MRRYSDHESGAVSGDDWDGREFPAGKDAGVSCAEMGDRRDREAVRVSVHGFGWLAPVMAATVVLCGCGSSAGVREVAQTVTTRVAKVPSVIGLDLSHAYTRLHSAGLAVTFAHSFGAGSFECMPVIAKQSPAAGRRWVGAVTLIPRLRSCGAASPAVPTGSLPRARVPDFTGATVLDAVRWAAKHQLYWQAARLPALHSATASRLLANYQIGGQAPRPGATLKLGDEHRTGRHSGSFRPTPLILHARKRPGP